MLLANIKVVQYSTGTDMKKRISSSFVVICQRKTGTGRRSLFYKKFMLSFNSY
jgi:hypothetical protein